MKKFILILLLTAVSFGQIKIPDKPAAWVNDYANVLSNRQESRLNEMLKSLQEETSTQIFVAISDRLPEDEYLESFAVNLFEKWGPGRKQEQNGILIVLFTEDRKIRIETGYGLEGAFTDLQAGRVIDNYMKPFFRKGDYYGGLEAGLTVIIAAVKGEYKIPTESPRKKKDKKSPFPIIVLILIIFSIINCR